MRVKRVIFRLSRSHCGNASGELGNGTSNSSNLPAQLTGLAPTGRIDANSGSVFALPSMFQCGHGDRPDWANSETAAPRKHSYRYGLAGNAPAPIRITECWRWNCADVWKSCSQIIASQKHPRSGDQDRRRAEGLVRPDQALGPCHLTVSRSLPHLAPGPPLAFEIVSLALVEPAT